MRHYLSIILGLAFLFLLGCSSKSSPVAPAPELSSSSVTPSSSSSVAPSNSSSSVTPSNSSSSVTPSNSSSSVAPSNSSSSVTPPSSSSSVAPPSSSSSVAPSNSSSSVTPPSSSSSVAPSSSSSLWTPPFHSKRTYGTLLDTRNGKEYATIVLKGYNDTGAIQTINVMAENLNYAEVITLGANEQDNDSKIEKYCYNDNADNCILYGGLYQWAEMVGLPYECNLVSCADQIAPEQHQGICPDGWHLLTKSEFWVVVNSSGEGIRGVKSDSRWIGGGGNNASGYTLLGGGYRKKDASGYADLQEAAYQYYPSPEKKAQAAAAYIGASDAIFGLDGSNTKTAGFSVRCVENY